MFCSNNKMNYHNITHDDMNNGDGLRVVLWVSGCSHQCHNCQNPQTWDPRSGIKFDEQAKKEIFEQLDKSYISGITFSGGDPLYIENLNDIEELIYDIKIKYGNTKTIWLYTGYTFEEIANDIINQRMQIVCHCDVLVDGEFIESQKDTDLKWRGSKNQRVIDIQKTLQNKKIVLWCD